MNDRLHNAIMSVFNEGFERDRQQREVVREEIKQRGSYWAAQEIWELRRSVKSLRARLDRQQQES